MSDYFILKLDQDGPEIKWTDFWTTEMCQRGLFFLTTNAGCSRLLVPTPFERQIPDMTKDVIEVVLTTGPMRGLRAGSKALIPAIEIMFEDGSDAPFAIHIGEGQWDRMWEPGDEGNKQWRFALYTQAGKQAEFPCYLRSHSTLPYRQRRHA